MTRSDATDHRRSLLGPCSPTRWPLPPLIAATTALATAALGLALATPTGRGTTDPDPAGAALAAGRLAPAQAQRAQAQAVADQFAQTFARSLSRPVTARELRVAGASADLAHRILTARPPTTTPSRARSAVGDPGPPRAGNVSVRADRGGWLATATVQIPDATARRATGERLRLPLTFRLKPRGRPADSGSRGRLVVVDANPGGRE